MYNIYSTIYVIYPERRTPVTDQWGDGGYHDGDESGAENDAQHVSELHPDNDSRHEEPLDQ